MRIFSRLLLVTFFLLSSIVVSVAEDGGPGQYGLVMTPFNNVDAGKFANLRDSIQNMLTSRLASRDNVQIIDKGLSAQQIAKIKKTGNLKGIGDGRRKMFLVTGDLVSIHGGLKTRVVLYPLDLSSEKEGKPQSFTADSTSAGTIISDIDKLAREISLKAFQEQPSVVENGSSDNGASAFVTQHPEAAYKRGLYANLAKVTGINGFEAHNVGARNKFDLDFDVLNVQVGDFDGDGKQEVFFFAPDRIEVRQIVDGELVKIDGCRMPDNLRIHSYSMVDLNGDGQDEIYVSATKGIEISSCILCWSRETHFTWIARDIRDYIRPVNIPGKGMQLIVQRRGVDKVQLRRPGLYYAALDKNHHLVRGKALSLPESVNLFDFHYADLDGDGKFELVTIDSFNHLKVFNSTNDLLWVSQKLYGGSKTYIGPTPGEATDKQSINGFSVEEDRDRDMLYLPGRLIVTDFNNDGRQEIVVSESDMPMVSFFIKSRPYSSGKIVGMSWDGQEMKEFWETSSFPGYLADFAFLLQPTTETTEGAGEKIQVGTLYVADLASSGTLRSLLPGNDDSSLVVSTINFIYKKNK